MVSDDSKLKSLSLWQKMVLFGAAYFFCAEAAGYLSARDRTFMSFWLPAGLFLAVLLLNRTRDWPWLVLAVFPANFLFDHFYGTKFSMILAFYCANTIQAVTGAWLVRRFVVERPTLATLKEFIGLIGFAVIISAMLGATIGAEALVYSGLSQSFEQSWKVLWGSNAMAILLLTPFILTWFSKSNQTRDDFSSPKKIAEAVALVFALLLYIWLLFYLGHGIMSMNRSWAIPLLLWAGLRFGARGATAASLFLSLTISFFTTQFAIGLNGVQISTGQYVFQMQAVLAMASLVALIPAIVVGERNRTLTELRESEERFKNLAAAAFEGICISENGRILDVNNQFVTMFGYEQRGEIIGRQIVEFVAPAWRDSVAERIRAGQETIYGHKLLRKDGSTFFAEAQAQIVRVGDRTLRMTALRDISERKRAELEREQAVAREQQLHIEYTFQLIASQEAERTRVARELHDSLGQNLLLIKNRAQLAMSKTKLPDDLREQFQNIDKIVSSAIAEVRHIAHDLHPQQLDLLGLTRALQTLIENTDVSSTMAIDGKFEPVDDILSREAAINVYRIVQESLNNIFKHSHAKKARVVLERDVHEVLLKIDDDGCGFKSVKNGSGGKGMGLKNITERVRMLGGKMKLDSKPGKGTHIEITIPISTEQQ